MGERPGLWRGGAPPPAFHAIRLGIARAEGNEDPIKPGLVCHPRHRAGSH